MRRTGFRLATRWWPPVLLFAGLAVALVGPAFRAGAAAGSAHEPGAGNHRMAPASSGRPMPDTVLATVTDDRQVTLSGFRSAWRQVDPPNRPDSLTPESARKFLDLLIDKEALAVAALKESWVWTDKESAEYQATLDGLTMKVVLDSVLAGTRARLAASGASPGGVPVDSLGPVELGIAARESSAVALGVRFDMDVLGRLTRAFAAVPKPAAESSLMSQLRMINVLPEVPAADYPKPVAWTHAGPYTVGEVMTTWKNLSPVYRPRVETGEQMQDIVENQLFERELRAAVARRGIAAWPPIATALARKREYIAVTHLVGREVYGKIAMDSVTLHRYYVANRSHWDLPLRVAVARFVLPTRESAAGMVQQLAEAVRAESLLARGARAGANYMFEVTAESDSALFARAMRAGPGTILGPDEVDGGFEVIRVMGVEPPRSRTFQECRKLVGQKWYGVEGERLMVDLLARCRAGRKIRINEAALRRLTSS